MRSLYQKINKYVSLGAIIIFAISIFSAVVYLFCAIFEKFADFINLICAPIRAALSVVTSIVPFSIFEIILVLTPLWGALLIFFAIKISKKGTIASIKYLCIILCIPLCYFISFVWTFASGYHMTPIEQRMELDREETTSKELYQALDYLTSELNELKGEIAYDGNGASIMPYSYKEMSKKVSQAYKEMSRDTGLLKTFNSRVKPVIFSDLMAYTHISGVYISLTGESNINTAYADYIVASTSAHEMAHQRGIAKEDEASFVGFLALSYSSDPYLKYSAYLDVYYYLLSDLASTSPDLAKEVYAKLDNDVKKDREAFVKDFQKYKDSVASTVTDKVNDSYLQANGDKNGTKSYNLVSELVCAYLNK